VELATVGRGIVERALERRVVVGDSVRDRTEGEDADIVTCRGVSNTA